jgi:pimeloyl-ACP methyl ester carboxylesterase
VPPGEITAPTWVVHGTDDRVVPYENAALVQARIRQAEVIAMNSCGHLCWLERSHVLNRLLVGVASR